MSSKVIVVGSSHAGANVAYSLRRDGFDGQIDLFTTETFLPYHRPPLSKDFLKDKVEENNLLFKKDSFYEDNSIVVHLDTEVSSINREEQTISYKDRSQDYDYLVLATGSLPRKLDLPNSDAKNILYLRDLTDAKLIKESLAHIKHVTLLGGGYIGLEVASALIELNYEVTLLEVEERILKRVTTDEISKFYHDYHSSRGVQIICSTGIEQINVKGELCHELLLTNGDNLKTDLMLVGIGAIPNTDLANAAGLECDGGLHVDHFCRTKDPRILGAGDCTFHFNELLQDNLRLESVPNALAQSKVVASSIIGNDLTYKELPWFWSDQYDLKLQMAGISRGFDDFHVIGDTSAASFLACYGKNGHLIAVDSVNQPKQFMLLKKALSSGSKISMEIIKDPEFSPDNIFSGSS
tara:strand:- start:1515 stop:2741 length:1227 start_codon:yes stop_codon:yes gene_type:complete